MFFIDTARSIHCICQGSQVAFANTFVMTPCDNFKKFKMAVSRTFLEVYVKLKN